MTGMIVLIVYALLMVGATKLFTKQEGGGTSFHVGNRDMGTVVSAMSIAATWIWAPALFTSAEKAYSNGIAGLFWFLVPNILCLILFIPFARKIRRETPDGITLSGYMHEKYRSEPVKRVYLFQLTALTILSTAVQLLAGGKILSMAQLIYNLVQRGKINPAQLTVQFIDEEAIFPCIEDTVKKWRKRFLLMGAKFEWFCLEVKHYNCFNELSNDETFICWDRTKEDVWVRRPPVFAIRNHPLLRPRVDAYQDFLPRICQGGITITGIRTAESIQRLQNIASMIRAGKTMTNKHQVFPIYDWTNNDVWLYLLNEHVDIPEIYLFLWQAGTRKGQLRVSQFFSVDTARSLVKMNEYYPDLMERVIRREPNAYLAALYWDSEMFGRNSVSRKANEANEEKKDYKAELIEMFNNMDVYFTTEHKRYVATRYRNFFLQVSAIANEKDFKAIYEGLISGDPKLRTYRALYQRIYGRYITEAKREEAKKHG